MSDPLRRAIAECRERACTVYTLVGDPQYPTTAAARVPADGELRIEREEIQRGVTIHAVREWVRWIGGAVLLSDVVGVTQDRDREGERP
jgi:hypothetical protein